VPYDLYFTYRNGKYEWLRVVSDAYLSGETKMPKSEPQPKLTKKKFGEILTKVFTTPVSGKPITKRIHDFKDSCLKLSPVMSRGSPIFSGRIYLWST